MKTMKYLSILFILLSSQTHANVFYRHVPFNLHLNSQDTVIVDYDYAGKKGIYCEASVPAATIHFVYKGYLKTSHLPVLLQNAQVPEKPHEELADIFGQFRISLLQAEKNQIEYDIHCDYDKA